MESYSDKKLKDTGFRRVILGGLALDLLVQLLEPYIDSVIKKLHGDFMAATSYTSPTCGHTVDTYKEVMKCPTCKVYVDFLNNVYDNGSPNKGNVAFAWNNSDILKWSDPWYVAMLFMSKGVDPTKCKGPLSTDLTGVTALLINCEKFQMDKQLVKKIRDNRNTLAHRHANFTLDEKQFDQLMKDVEALLEDTEVKPFIPKVALKALQNIRKRDVSMVDVFNSLDQRLDEQLVTLRAMICSRSLFDEKNLAASERLVEEIDLHLADGATDSAHANMDKQKKKLEQHIKSLNLTSQLIRRYQAPDYEHINPMPWLENAALVLDSCYQETTMAESKKKVNVGAGSEQEEEEEEVEEEEEEEVHVGAGSEQEDTGPGRRFSNLEELLPGDPSQASRVLLVGPPGSSKSTSCKKLARQWMAGKDIGQLNRYSLLFVIPTAMLTESMTESLVKHLALKPCNSKELEAILDHHEHALLVVDGYDEGSKEQRELVNKLLAQNFLEKVTVLVTARGGFVSNEKVNFIYKCLGFNSDQKEQYIHKFFNQTTCKEKDKKSQLVLDAIQDKASHLRQLCENPMSAYLICNMAAAGVPLTASTKTELYDSVYEFLKERASSKGTEDEEQDIVEAFRLAEEAVYYHLLKENTYVLTEESVQKYSSSPKTLLTGLPTLGLTTRHNVMEFVKNKFKERPQYTLNHKTTAEFVAAKHVCQLDLDAKCKAVIDLVKKGPESAQILQFVFGLESMEMERPEHLVSEMEALGKLLHADVPIDSPEQVEMAPNEENLLLIQTPASDRTEFGPESQSPHNIEMTSDKDNLPVIQSPTPERPEPAIQGGGVAAEVVTRGVSVDVNNPHTRPLLSALVGDVSLTDDTVRPLLAVWAPILESTLTYQQVTAALGHDPDQWGESESGDDTLQQAVLRAGRLEGVEELYVSYMSSAITDHLLHAMPRLTGITRLHVFLHTAQQCRDLWRGARHLLQLQDLKLYGKGEYEATAGNPGDTTPDDHVTPAPPLLEYVKLTSLPLQTAAQLAPLCDWVCKAPKLQRITIDRCRAPCGTLRQQLVAALRQRGADMEYVGIEWEAGDGEEEDWWQLEQELRPYVRRLYVERSLFG